MKKSRRGVFRMPAAVTITGRSSSITAAFVSSVIPVVEPTDDEVTDALVVLGMTAEDVRCAYCGDAMTEWDHLRPLVSGQQPTGHVSEIGNLVPSCGKCNQSKGNKPWKDWILGPAARSPKTRGITDLAERIQRLEAYERWKPRDPLDFSKVVPAEVWSEHWANWKSVLEELKRSQAVAAKIRRIVAEA